MRIVELSLIKILNKQLFLAGEVKMIRLIILITTFLGLTIGSANADPKKIGFIYIGPPGDHGWTYMHDQGRQYMESQLGDAVSSTYIENVPENADAVRAIRKLAASGHDLIFTTSFNYMDQTLEVAKEFPDTDDNGPVLSSKEYLAAGTGLNFSIDIGYEGVDGIDSFADGDAEVQLWQGSTMVANTTSLDGDIWNVSDAAPFSFGDLDWTVRH